MSKKNKKKRKDRKPVLVTFVRGPLHLIQAEMTWIPEVNVVRDEREKTVYAYVRDEMTYYYDPAMSASLTSIFEQVKTLFRSNPVDVVGQVVPPDLTNKLDTDGDDLV